MSFAPTPEQQAIVEAVAAGHNCMVEALAGCAKTSTISLALPAGRRSLYLVFNKKNQVEAEARLGARAQVKTLNGLGHLAIARALGKPLVLDASKAYKLAKDLGLTKDDQQAVVDLLSLARQRGIIPQGQPGKPLVLDSEAAWLDLADELDIDPKLIVPARQAFGKSFRLALDGTIDFSDQIYISALVFGSFPQADCVFVDEAQDLSPLNHAQLAKLPGRPQLVVVGDRRQAIYAFRGADHMSMDTIRQLRPAWTDLTLSTTFRCPRAIVERLRDHAPLFQAGPSNLPGSIESPGLWSPAGGSSAAIICRNNKPLVRLAFRLLRAGIPFVLAGRDMGKTMKRLFQKLPAKARKDKALAIEAAHALAQGDPKKRDQWEALAVVLEACEASRIESTLDSMAKPKDGAITLSTGHRAKGLEWPLVYHLEPGLIPSEYASSEAELIQEDNLRYVIESRTSDRLLLVTANNLELGA